MSRRPTEWIWKDKPMNDFRTPELSGLNRIADAVLAYRPKPKTKPARKRARARKKAKDARLL